MSRYQRMRQIHRDAELALETISASEHPGPDQISWVKEYLRYILENSRRLSRKTLSKKLK